MSSKQHNQVTKTQVELTSSSKYLLTAMLSLNPFLRLVLSTRSLANA